MVTPNTSAIPSGTDTVFDIVVYGASPAGIMAAITAAQKGRSVVLLEPSGHLGGLVTGGLGATDIGVEGALGGLSLEFFRRIRAYYADDSAWKRETREAYAERPPRRFYRPDSEGMFGFEPHAAKAVYQQMLAEAGVRIVMNERLRLNGSGVDKAGPVIRGVEMESGRRYRARVFIDASYEADLMALAGVRYHVGRESNDTYGETLNGVQAQRTHGHVFRYRVDPYLESGNPGSGVLPGIDPAGPGEEYSEDLSVQAYCFRMCLTDDPGNRIPIEKPEGYEPLWHELLFRNIEAGDTRPPWINSPMPNRKSDINNFGPVSINYIGMNDDYPNGSHAARERIVEEHRLYQQGHMWAMANDPRIPKDLRRAYGAWGLAADEYADTGHWTPQLYIREARRMVGEYVMTEHDCRRLRVADDPIGLGSYNMDSHNVQRYITEDGAVQTEGNLEIPPGGPYAISYRATTPKRSECSNLLVCGNGVSSSHIAFGSIRMEPVFMVLGQSAALAAHLALDADAVVQSVSYPELRAELLAADQRVDVDIERWPPRPPRDERD